MRSLLGENMDYFKICRPYDSEALFMLRKIIRIPSLYDASTIKEGQPFGENIFLAMREMASLALRYGFEVDYCNGYALEISYGHGDRLINIYAHIDVVPVSEKWIHKPFDLSVEKGKMYGRGVSDDKGPLMASFYAIKALKDNGLIKNYRVKLVIGGDEERGSSCLEYYFKTLKKEQATYAFTPDSDFPLIYGEKGITSFDAFFDIKLEKVQHINGGLVYNAVNDLTTIIMEKDEGFVNYLLQNKVNFTKNEVDNDLVELKFIGVSAHGASPQKGKNAALIFLKHYGHYFHNERIYELATKLIETSGKLFDGYYKSKELKGTTYCVGLIDYDNDKLKLGINVRYPENVDVITLVNNFKEKFACRISDYENGQALLFSKKSPLVKTLLKAYRLETGDHSKPFTIGGGTYSKHALNCVAFGATFPGDDTNMHGDDEWYLERDYYRLISIYAHAIHALGKLK